MSQSMFSQVWYRAAALKPKWRLHVRADRQVSRGEIWHVLSNSVGVRSSRLDANAFAVVGRCDGRASLEEIWQALLKLDADHAPTQDEMLMLISQLVSDGFLECESWPDIGRIMHEDERSRAAKRSAKMNPLSMRFGLGNPSRLLRRQTRWAHRIFSPAGLIGWIILMIAAAIAGLANLDEVGKHAGAWLDTPRYWLLAWVCFVPVKFIHEWSHALAVRRFGGQVREVGIGLLMFFPAPYVDASDANRFSSGRRRALVSAAGILSEMAMAAIALLVWIATEPGWIRDIAFTVAFIGGVSTLMFNANPLMRMDGYFVLSDWAQLPNLAVRSGQYWQHILQRRWLGVAPVQSMQFAPGERKWLLGYAPAAWLYRFCFSVWLVLWVGEIHRWLALLTGLLMLLWIAVIPLTRLLTSAQRAARTYRQRILAPARLGLVIAVVLLVGGVVPLPDTRIAEGIVWMHEDTQVRAPIEGFVATGTVSEQTALKRDDLILQLDDPILKVERQRIEQRRPGLTADLYASLRSEPARSRQIQEQLKRLDAELVRIDERLGQLRIQAASDGTLGLARPDDLPGRFIKQGEILGVIQNGRAPIIRVAMNQDEAARVSRDARGVAVRLAELPGQALAARLVRQQPAAAAKLPSAALAENNGGSIQVDPTDKDGTKPAYPTFLFDVELPPAVAGAPDPQLGGRAWVRFEFGQSPLWSQLARAMRQTIRVRFAAEQV